MKTALLSFILLAAIPLLGEEPGFVSIFNGKDLGGWTGKEGAWVVEDGAIKCAGLEDSGKNWLVWEGGKPADFELRLEFKYESGNSGVQVRSHFTDEPYHVQGYQVEIASHDKMGLWHHSLAPEKYRSLMAFAGENTVYAEDGEKTVETFGDGEEIKKLCKDGEWNELVVIVKGDTLIQKINGQLFSQLTDKDAKYKMSEGVIAFQDHGKGTVASFRNIRLKVLD